MNKLFYKYYVFLDFIDEEIKKNLLKFKNLSIIINNITASQNLGSEINIVKFAKIKRIPFFFKNSFKKCIKYNSDGVFIESSNKRFIKPILLKKKNKIIGLVHNQIDYFIKINQSCEIVMLSPIFSNPKYSKNKILNVIKFNLLSLNWKANIGALGGINSKNIKKIQCTKSNHLAFMRAIKNPSALCADGYSNKIL